MMRFLYVRPTLFLLFIVLLCSLSAVAQAQSAGTLTKRHFYLPSDPATVIVWPQQFTVVHDPPSQTTGDVLYIENVSFQPRTFTIYEGEDNCTPSGDVPWVSAEPTSGNLPLKGALEISLTFSSVGLANGTYTGEICVLTNDPQTPRTDVSLTLQVGPLPTATPTPPPPTATPTATPVPPTNTRHLQPVPPHAHPPVHKPPCRQHPRRRAPTPHRRGHP